jgi:hypothetical protein
MYGMKVEELTPFPPGENPFRHDLYHMGTPIGNDVVVMHCSCEKEAVTYLIIVHIPTGNRIKVWPELLEPSVEDHVKSLTNMMELLCKHRR